MVASGWVGGRIVHLRWGCSADEWQAIVDRIPTATFFHTAAWAATYTASGRGRCDVLRADWPDGRQALIPVGVRRIWRGLGRSAAIGFDGGYGGILATAPLHPDERQWLWRRLSRRYGDWTLATNPFEPPAWPDLPVDLVPAGPTLAVPLAPLEVVRRRYDKERRHAARQAERNGVVVTEVPADHPDRQARFWAQYHQAADAWRRLGRPLTWIRDEAWFRALWQCAGDRLLLLMAHHEGRPVGAELLAIQGTIAVELFAAWDRQAAKLQVATALTEGAMHAALVRGCTLLDAMPSGPLRGVERFKASFGAVAHPIWHAHRRPWYGPVMAWPTAWRHRPATGLSTPLAAPAN